MEKKWRIVAWVVIIVGVLIYFGLQKDVGLSPKQKNDVGSKTNDGELTLKEIFKTNNVKQQSLYNGEVFGGELR